MPKSNLKYKTIEDVDKMIAAKLQGNTPGVSPVIQKLQQLAQAKLGRLQP